MVTYWVGISPKGKDCGLTDSTVAKPTVDFLEPSTTDVGFVEYVESDDHTGRNHGVDFMKDAGIEQAPSSGGSLDSLRKLQRVHPVEVRHGESEA